MSDTLVEALREASESPRDTAGIRFLDRRERATWLGFREVWARAQRVAGALQQHGVRAGDRVAIILPTAPSFIDCFFGALLAGAVPVALYPPVRLGRLDEYFEGTAAMLQAAEAVVLLTEPRIRRLLGKVVARYAPPLGMRDAAGLLDGSPASRPRVDPDDLALVQFSSGTTVAPKPVGLTHRQLLANARRIRDVVLDIDPQHGPTEPAGVSWLPLYHDMGLIGAIFPAVLAHGPITLLPPEAFLARPALWLRAISRYQATISPAPNFAYGLCLEKVEPSDIQGIDLSSWHLALNGAEPAVADTMRAFADRFAPYGFDAHALTPVYGLSEAALAVTFSDPRAPFRSVHVDREALSRGEVELVAGGVELVSVGSPLPDFQVRVADDHQRALPEAREGHILVRGPSVMRGYIDRAEQPVEDGWLQTGDLGFVLDGDLFVTGRAKDVIIVRGRNHAPHDIERAADTVPGVRTGCVAAVAQLGEHGERLLVFAEVREEEPGQAQAICRAVRSRAGLDADLVVLLAPGTLPRTSSGKIRRAESLRRWQAGTLTPPQAVTPLSLAGALAGSAWARLTRRRD